LPFNKYAYLTTHNSFSIRGEPSHTGVPRITLYNQEDSVTDQLNVQICLFQFLNSGHLPDAELLEAPVMQNGVRALMLDVYDFRDEIWLCH
jgi:hypothetical protein